MQWSMALYNQISSRDDAQTSCYCPWPTGEHRNATLSKPNGVNATADENNQGDGREKSVVWRVRMQGKVAGIRVCCLVSVKKLDLNDSRQRKFRIGFLSKSSCKRMKMERKWQRCETEREKKETICSYVFTLDWPESMMMTCLRLQPVFGSNNQSPLSDEENKSNKQNGISMNMSSMQRTSNSEKMVGGKKRMRVGVCLCCIRVWIHWSTVLQR